MIHHVLTGLMQTTVVEDGMNAGEAMPALQTFLWFFAAPIGLFLGISAIVTVLTADRQKKYSSGDLTRID